MTWRQRLRPWKHIKYLKQVIQENHVLYLGKLEQVDEHIRDLRASVGHLTRVNAELELEVREWREEGGRRGFHIK